VLIGLADGDLPNLPDAGTAGLLAKGSGANLPAIPLPLSVDAPGVRVQLQRLDAPICWETTFTAPDVRSNSAALFNAKR
jgi:hypothetical protein